MIGDQRTPAYGVTTHDVVPVPVYPTALQVQVYVFDGGGWSLHVLPALEVAQFEFAVAVHALKFPQLLG